MTDEFKTDEQAAREWAGRIAEAVFIRSDPDPRTTWRARGEELTDTVEDYLTDALAAEYKRGREAQREEDAEFCDEVAREQDKRDEEDRSDLASGLAAAIRAGKEGE